ncbi:MAG: beta-galactosidase, partial [Planctomycetes bacterium]|nr:beta-galactosidase [Planctomycetota bacterium]
KNIDNLNKVWSTGYPGFKSIKFPPDCEKMVITHYADLKKYRYWENRAMWYDWLTFNEERFTDFIKWERESIKKIDPKTAVHLKINGPTVFKEVSNRSSINIENLLEITEIAGYDLGVYPPEITEDTAYAFDNRLESKVLDLYKSLYPEKPTLNSEWHALSHVEWPTRDYVRSAMWDSVIHGVSFQVLWCWGGHWTEGQWGIVIQSESLETLAETSLELQRLAPYIIEFPKAKRNVALLYSNPSILQSGSEDYPKELDNAYDGLRFLDTSIGFISEKQISQIEDRDYNLLIFPKANYITEKAYQGIKKYLNSGGDIFVIKDSLGYNEYGYRRDISELFEAESESMEIPGVEKQIKEIEYGKGKIYISESSLTPGEYADILEVLLDRVGAKRDIRVSRGFSLIESRTVTVDGKKVTYLINLNRGKTVKVKLESTIGDIIQVKDLVAGQILKTREIELVPMNPMLLEITLVKKD